MTFPQCSGIYRRKANIALLISIVFLATLPTLAQATHPLTGRHIAGVMGVGGAPWLERPERESEENVDGALTALETQGVLRTGMTVAEVGAGTGYVSLRLARRVGPQGKVYATDIQPKMLEMLRDNASKAGLHNVETVLGTPSDPKLPAGRIDMIILVDVYHEFSEPQKMLAGIRAALKPEGRLVQLEYRKEDPSVPILEDHKMSVAGARQEVEAEGFKLGPVVETLPRQHILIYRKLLQ